MLRLTIALAVGIAPLGSMIGVAAYAGTRPASDSQCHTYRDLIIGGDKGPRMGTVTECYWRGIIQTSHHITEDAE